MPMRPTIQYADLTWNLDKNNMEKINSLFLFLNKFIYTYFLLKADPSYFE